MKKILIGHTAKLALALALTTLIADPVFAQGVDGPNARLVVTTITNFVRFLSVGIGVVLVVMFGWAGYKYLTARDNSAQVAQAKQAMFNVFLSLFLFIFGFALLNWLLPGGIVGINQAVGN